jgi:hypothetical protein
MEHPAEPDADAVPRLQPGTRAGGGVPRESDLPAEWQSVVAEVEKTLAEDDPTSV